MLTVVTVAAAVVDVAIVIVVDNIFQKSKVTISASLGDISLIMF